MSRGELPVELEIQEAEDEVPAGRGRGGAKGRGSTGGSADKSDKGSAVKAEKERDGEQDDASEDEKRCGVGGSCVGRDWCGWFVCGKGGAWVVRVWEWGRGRFVCGKEGRGCYFSFGIFLWVALAGRAQVWRCAYMWRLSVRACARV